MAPDLQDLKKIGLTQGEIKLYSALLDLGESTRTQLSKKSGISPSKIYDVANRLIEKGIISSVKKNTIIHFSAANPERIKDFLKQKEEEIVKEKQLVKDILPLLLSKYKKTEDSTDIEVFYGWEGMKTAYSSIARKLKKGDTSYVLGASTGEDEKMSNIFFPQYYQQVKKSGYKIKVIFNENVKKQRQQVSYFIKSKLHEIKFLHQDTFAEFNLYKNIVLIVMLSKNPIVIKVKNKTLADSMKKFFDTMWQQAKSE